MAGVREFQKRLLTDSDARRRFAEDPQAVLAELGVTLPPDTTLPPRIPLEDLNRAVAEFSEALSDERLDLDQLDASSTANVTRFVENAVPLRTKDIRLMEAVHDEFATEALRLGRSPEDTATVAVVAAVVAVVVGVVGAFADVSNRIRERFRPELGIEAITSRARGMVVHGPQGLRIEGAGVDQVAEIIATLQKRFPGGN